MERAFNAKDSGDDEEFAIWASLSLELLGKSLLSKINPILIIDTKDPLSAIASIGIESENKIRTIGAREVYQRIQKIHPVFSHNFTLFCIEASEQRNSELHSGTFAFQKNSIEWEDKFFHAASRILSGFKYSVSNWLENPPLGDKISVKIENIRNTEIRVGKAEVEEKKGLWAKMNKNQKKEAKEKADDFYLSQFEKWIQNIGGTIHQDSENIYRRCPACKNEGFLVGTDPVKTILSRYESQSFLLSEVLEEYSAFAFFCPYCTLELEEDFVLEAAGIDSYYTHETTEERCLKTYPMGTQEEDHR